MARLGRILGADSRIFGHQRLARRRCPFAWAGPILWPLSLPMMVTAQSGRCSVPGNAADGIEAREPGPCQALEGYAAAARRAFIGRSGATIGAPRQPPI
jgi:hypothetical protein